MIAYADASLLVPLFVADRFAARAEAFLQAHRPRLLVSDFGAAEFASAVSKKLRTGELAQDEAQAAFPAFDVWIAQHGPRLEVIPSDVVVAESWLRRLDLGLRTPDALNIAVAQRHGAALATFDLRMAEAARALGLELAPV